MASLLTLSAVRSQRTLRTAPGLTSLLVVNLRPVLLEWLRLLLHSPLERFLLVGKPLLRGIVAHVLRDFHRAEMRAAHRAEVRELGTFLRQRLVVELARLV